MNSPTFQDPINALAAHFRSSGLQSVGKHAALRIPSFLRKILDGKRNPQESAGKISIYSTTREVKDLVESIGEEEFERWCFLDATAFTFVVKILLGARPCLAKDQGFFRLIEALETLRDENNELGMPKKLLSDYKDSVGESLAVELLGYFIDPKESDFSRRWVGLLLVELLEESEVNRERVWEMPDEIFKDIGEVITTGDDRMLKIVAGKIIWQMMQDFKNEEEIQYRLSTFWQPEGAGNLTKDFPLQDGSQWESGFANFVTKLEEDRYDLDLGLPTGYNGVQVKLGNSPINSSTGAISISIAEIFSIYIPPNQDCSPDWVDFKIVNVSGIEFTSQGVTGDAMDQLIYFKVHLCDFEKDGYLYLLSMRPSSDSDNVMILCYKNEVEDFAEDVKRCRHKVLQRKRSQPLMRSAPIKDIQANPTHYQSQQEKLDELERHREDILKVLESPAKNDSSITDPDEDPDESADERSQSVSKQEARGVAKAPGKEAVEVGSMGVGEKINNAGSGYSGDNFSLTSVTDRQETSKPNPATRTLAEIPGIIRGGAGMVPGLSPPILFASGGRLRDSSKVVLRSSSPSLRSSMQVQQVGKPLGGAADSGLELSDITDLADEGSQQKIPKQPDKETLAAKESNEHLGRNSGPVMPEVTKNRAGKLQGTGGKRTSKPQPEIPDAAEPSDGPLSGFIVTGKPAKSKANSKPNPRFSVPSAIMPLDIPRVEKSTEFKDHMKSYPQHPVLDRHFPGEVLPLKNLRSAESNNDPKGSTRSMMSTTAENPEDIHTPPNTYQTKNRAKEKHLDDSTPENKTNEVQSKLTAAPKARAITQKLGGAKLISSDDTSIWDLPDSEGSEKGKERSLKKGKGKSKATTEKELNTTKSKQPAKRKPLPRKRVYGKKSVTKPAPKPEKVTLDSGEEMKSMGEMELPVHAPKQKPKPQPKRQAAHTSVQKNEDGEIESTQKEKFAIHSLRLKKSNPKQKTAGGSVPPKLAVAQHNEDEEIKSAEKADLPVPVPMSKEMPPPGSKPGLAPNPVPAKHIGRGEKTKSAEDRRVPPQPPKPRAAQKINPTLVPTKRMAGQDSGDDGRGLEGGQEISTTKQPKPKSIKKVAPPPTLANHTAVYNSDPDSSSSSEYAGPASKRKKKKPTKGTVAGGNLPLPHPTIKKVPENSRKRPKVDLLLNTSGADEHSSWKPKTRLQAKLELITKSAGRKNVADLGQTRPFGPTKTIPGGGRSDKPPEISKGASSFRAPRMLQNTSSDANALSIVGDEHWRIQQSPSLNPETSVEIPIQHHAYDTRESGSGLRDHPPENLLESSVHSAPRATHELEVSKSNTAYLEEDNAIVIHSDHSDNTSDLEELESRMIPAEPSQETDKLSRTRARVIAHDDTPSTGPHDPVVTATEASHRLGSFSIEDRDIKDDYRLENEQTEEDASKNRPLVIGHENLTGENPAPIATINLGTTPTLPINDNNQISKHPSRASTPSQEGNQNILFPLVTPRRLARTPQVLQTNPEMLINDRLARKAQIISWNSEGPKNQGRTPFIDKNPMDFNNTIKWDGFSSDKESPLPRPERAPSFYVFASEDEDRIINRKNENLRLLTFRPARRATETVVDKNGSPILAPTHERIESMGHLRTDGNRGDIKEQDEEDDEEFDLIMADTMDRPDYAQRRLSVESVQESEASAEAERFNEPKRTSLIDLWDFNDANADLKIESSSSDEDQASSTLDNIEEAEGHLHDNGLVIMKKETPQPHLRERAYRKATIIEITDNDSEPTEETVQRVPSKPPSIARRHPNRNLTVGKALADEKTNQFDIFLFSKTKERLLAPDNSTSLGETKVSFCEPLLLQSREVSPILVPGNVSPGALTGKGDQETGFFKWLRETESKKASNGSHNDQTVPRNSKKNSDPRDPDETLVNEDDHDDQRLDQGQGQERQGKNISGNSSDDSDFSSGSDEGSGTDGEDEEVSEDEEDPQAAWRQSLPDYHKETLAVLDQISQGLLRYLMSGEELAMEVIKDFEKQGNKIVKQLGDSHEREYKEFLSRVELAKEKIQKEHAKIMEDVEDDMAELGKQAATFSGERQKIESNYSALDNKVSRLIAGLEEELGRGMEL